MREPIPFPSLDGRGLRACPVLDTGQAPIPSSPIPQTHPKQVQEGENPSPGRRVLGQAARSDSACRAPTRAKTKTPASRPYAYIHMQEIHNPPQLSATPKYTTPTIALPAPLSHSHAPPQPSFPRLHYRHSREGMSPSSRGREPIPGSLTLETKNQQPKTKNPLPPP